LTKVSETFAKEVNDTYEEMQVTILSNTEIKSFSVEGRKQLGRYIAQAQHNFNLFDEKIECYTENIEDIVNDIKKLYSEENTSIHPSLRWAY
jgi:septation ring formation regulator EzrA